MSIQLLRASDVFPSDTVLEEALGGDVHAVLRSLLETIENEDYAVSVEWRFYNDGKAWLGKATHKKKTVFWLSVWEGYFKMSFLFTEKHRESIAELKIDKNSKKEFARTQATGRLIPLIMSIHTKEQIPDVLTLIQFKKKA